MDWGRGEGYDWIRTQPVPQQHLVSTAMKLSRLGAFFLAPALLALSAPSTIGAQEGRDDGPASYARVSDGVARILNMPDAKATEVHRPAKDTLPQRLNDVTTLNQRRHPQAISGTTIIFSNHQILSNIDKTSCQVTRVCSFKCGISQTFTSTVSRDEVLQYVKTFTEVSSNRSFNNGAIRFCHQATHTGKLTNLRG